MADTGADDVASVYMILETKRCSKMDNVDVLT